MNYNDIDDYNHLAEILPPCVKEECSTSGDNYYACEYWVTNLGLNIPREKVLKELKGIDFSDDLETCSDFDLNIKYLWMAASCDIDESINDMFAGCVSTTGINNLNEDELNEILEMLKGVK